MSDTHPLTLLGVAIAGGGWIFLMLGTSGGEFSGREIYNIHLGVIAENVIHLGYAIAVSGVIASVGRRIGVLPPTTQIEASNEGAVPEPLTELRVGSVASERAAALREHLNRTKEGLAQPEIV